jgi:Uma2 family endonuclease
MERPTDTKRRYTLEEYAALEEHSEDRYEYWDGQIVPLEDMAGGSYEHSLVTANFAGELREKLKGGPCRVLSPDLRVKVRSASGYAHPDVTVICGEPEFVELNGKPFAVKNPRVIIEVLSPSTERNDRGPKFRRYLELESLEEYILVSQDRPGVESYFRRPDGGWLFMPVDGLEKQTKLLSLGVEIPLAEIFRDVTFKPIDESDDVTEN